MIKNGRIFLAVCGGLALLPAVEAATVFTFNMDACSGTCGATPFGTVSLAQTGAGGAGTFVTVTEVLAANERFAGTGAGDALEFNVTGPITIGNITAGFGLGPAPDTASAFGTFLESVSCTACQGGNANNVTGPLSFTVSRASGVTIADFTVNARGYYFASDIVGNNGNTGNVGTAGPGANIQSTPEPATLALTGLGLLGLGAFGRRLRKSK